MLELSDEDSSALANRGAGSATALHVHLLRLRRLHRLATTCRTAGAWAGKPVEADMACSCDVDTRFSAPRQADTGACCARTGSLRGQPLSDVRLESVDARDRGLQRSGEVDLHSIRVASDVDILSQNPKLPNPEKGGCECVARAVTSQFRHASLRPRE